MRLNGRTVLGLALIVIVGGPAVAYAWGPATHTRLALDVLAQGALLPAAVAGLLARHAASFVFGNIAADVVFAKRMSRVKQFCHHWSTGFGFLERAGTEADRAFAHGYLSHLAADTVAHNKYVPRQLATTRATLNFGHLYWEMRADGQVDAPTWRMMQEVLAADHENHHAVLSAELTATLLPYHFNRRLFERINRTVTRDYWKACTDVWYRCSRWDLCRGLLAEYRQESVDRVLSVLAHGAASPVVREDPNGTAALHMVRLMRRERRRLVRRGVPIERHLRATAAALAPQCHGRGAYHHGAPRA